MTAFKDGNERTGGIIMGRELSETEVKNFIASNGLNIDLLDERDEVLEAWRLKWEGLAKGFMNYLQDRFTAIEHRLDRLEQRADIMCSGSYCQTYQDK